MDNIAYHFTGDKLRDGTPIPPIGETLVYKGQIELCRCGYHWSEDPFDALNFAPGPLLHKVRYGGEVIKDESKGVSEERTIIASIDATDLLRRFAADRALSVAHLWDMPDLVRDYLLTLDDRLQPAASYAARSGTRRPAGWVFASSESRYASEEAVYAAARSAEYASSAIRPVADASSRAAWSAADAAAWSESCSQSWAEVRLEFRKAVEEAFKHTNA